MMSFDIKYFLYIYSLLISVFFPNNDIKKSNEYDGKSKVILGGL